MSAGFCGSKAELDILSSSQDTVLETVQAKTCSFVKEWGTPHKNPAVHWVYGTLLIIVPYCPYDKCPTTGQKNQSLKPLIPRWSKSSEKRPHHDDDLLPGGWSRSDMTTIFDKVHPRGVITNNHNKAYLYMDIHGYILVVLLSSV